MNEAVQKGITVVAAAGNRGPDSGTLTCPGLAEEALTTVATMTKKEMDWWKSLPTFRKTWYKWSGQYGKIYGTSFSAAWASGLVVLLLSAFPDFHSFDINEAIHFSVEKNKIENPKLKVDFPNTKYAYDWLMKRRANENALGKDGYIIPRRYYITKNNINSFVFTQSMGAYMMDFNGLDYTLFSFTRDLEQVINYIWYLIRRQQYEFAIAELKNIEKIVSPVNFPLHHQKILDLMSTCRKSLS